jgi:hypothetical protein
VELGKAARIVSWKIEGFEVVLAAGHGLAADSFWSPGYMVAGAVRVVELSASDEGLVLVTERVLPRASRGLAGVKVRRRLLFAADGAIRLTTAVQNATENGLSISFRYANMPLLLAPPKGAEGWADLVGKDGPVRYARDFAKTAFRMADAARNPALERYGMDKECVIAGPTARLAGSWTPVRVEIAAPADQLYQIVFWDSGAQECPTAEWVFREVQIEPGGSWEASLSLRRTP